MNEIDKLLNEAQENYDEIVAHQEREKRFAEEANARFEKNFQAFCQYYPDVAQSIADFKTREDFCLHVTKSGHGNFYPQGSEVPLYGDDPIAQTEAQISKYTEQAFFGQVNYFNSPPFVATDDRIHIQYMSRLSDVLGKTKGESLTKMTALPESFPTCQIFGIGLGYHIAQLIEQHKFKFIFICEPDYELFFASLFCVDWAAIIEKVDADNASMLLYLGVDYESYLKSIFQTLERIGSFALSSSYCYQHYPSKEINELIKSFYQSFRSFFHGFGFYNDSTTGLAHAVKNMEQGVPLLYPFKSHRDRMFDKPVFIVGNGPSLDTAIPYIKKYQNKAIILAAGTAYQSLAKAGIEADFHVLVERPKGTYDIIVDIMPEKGYGNTNLLTVEVVYPDTHKLYKWSGMGLKGPETATEFIRYQMMKNHSFKPAPVPRCGPLVANTAMGYAAVLGFGEVYLFGVDNGHPETGEHHSKLSIYNDDKFAGKYKAHKTGEYVFEGNLGGKVTANGLFESSKRQLDSLVQEMDYAKVYNVGHGAKIEGALPLEDDAVMLDDLPDLDKTSVVDYIKQNFFKTFDLKDVEEHVAVDEFASLCDYLLEVGERPYSTREEAMEILIAQQRVVYAYKESKHSHLFYVIKGTMLYFHCPLVTLLYYFNEEEASLALFNEAFTLWQDFIREIKDDFPERWHTLCDLTF